MNKKLLRLIEISKKSHKNIVGLMSGTSLDGLDIVLCNFEGNTPTQKHFKTVEYSDELRERIRAVQSKPTVDLAEVCVLNTELAVLSAQWINDALKEWKVDSNEVDLIASHGQTIYHLPNKTLNSTLQIVDGDHIAEKTGITTISDFRQKHVAQGGEGAPLAGILDQAIFQSDTTNRVLLNLGGISNLTWLPATSSQESTFTTDVGPANTLINEAARKYFNIPYDDNAEIAKQGKVDSELVKYILLEPFFRKSFPKSTGQEDFNLTLVEELMKGYEIKLSPVDLMATLTEVTVQSLSRAFDELFLGQSYEVLASGGGIYNPLIMDGLKKRLSNATWRNFADFGFTADAKEAVLVAYLANLCVSGGDWELGKICL